MSSVSPSSSASQTSARLDVQWLAPADFCRLIETAASAGVKDIDGLVNRYIAHGNAYLRVLEKSFDAKSVGSSSNVSSDVSVGKSSVKTDASRSSRAHSGVRVAQRISPAVQRLSWRKEEKPPQPQVKSGYCYQKLLSKDKDLGPNPSMYDLLALPARDFRSERELRELRLAAPVLGASHVGDVGLPAYEVLVALAGTSAMPYTGPDSMWFRLHGIPASFDVASSVYSHGMSVGAALSDTVMSLLPAFGNMGRRASLASALDRLVRYEVGDQACLDLGFAYLKTQWLLNKLKFGAELPPLVRIWHHYEQGGSAFDPVAVGTSMEDFLLKVEAVGLVYSRTDEMLVRELVLNWK
jgi:hypothetical protein